MVKIKKRIKKDVPHVSVTELLSLVPDRDIEALSEELSADKWVKKLKAGTIFKLVLFSLLHSERLSQRVMESNYQDPMFQALSPDLVSDEVSWTGIRGRLMKLKVDFCKKMYESVYNQASQYYGEESLSGYHIKRYDSTMIATFAHLLEGMKVGNTSNGKTQVKLTCEMTDDFLIRMDFHKDQAHLSEETALKESILKHPHTAQDISVFDKGLKSRKTFEQLSKDEVLFVGRLTSTPRYQLLYPHSQDDDMSDSEELEFVQDSIVYLYEDKAKLLETKFRLVQFRLKKDGEILSFVTNILGMPTQTIAQIYRSRWDIEVLFRFMKQEMNLTHFVCNDLNAIQVMLYFTLIAAMLVLIYKKKNNIGSYKLAKIQFFKELLYSILLDTIETPQGVESLKEKLKKYVKRE